MCYIYRQYVYVFPSLMGDILKRSLRLLQNIQMKELERSPVSDSTANKVQAFLEQYSFELELLPRKEFDAEVLLEAVLNARKELGENSLQNQANKINKLFEAFPEKVTGKMAHELSELWMAIDTIENKTVEEMTQLIRGYKTKHHIDLIIDALNREDNLAASQAFLSFGEYLRDEFPNANLEKILKSFKNMQEFKDKDLPNLALLGANYEALGDIYNRVALQEDVKNIVKCDALKKGMVIFAELIGGERIEAGLADLKNKMTESAIQIAADSIERAKPNEQIARALINELKNDQKECRSHLESVIQSEMRQFPQRLTFYQSSGKLDFNRLSLDIAEERSEFGKWGKNKNLVSNKLVLAAKSYQAISDLDRILQKEAKPQHKLQEYKQALESKKINNALRSNPDSKVAAFFKKAAYYVANFLTFGILDLITKGSFLHSHQQNLAKKSLQSLKDAEEKQIIEGPKS